MSSNEYYNSNQSYSNNDGYQRQQYNQGYHQSYSSYEGHSQSGHDNQQVVDPYRHNSYNLPNHERYSPQPPQSQYSPQPQSYYPSQPSSQWPSQAPPQWPPQQGYGARPEESRYSPQPTNHNQLPPSYAPQYGQESTGYGHAQPPHYGQSPPPPTYGQPQYNAPQADDGERGVMGALAGGAAGAYSGHQINHGVLGALGGAFAGHKIQDHFSDEEKKKKKEEEERKKQQAAAAAAAAAPTHHQDHHQQSSGLAGNFSASCNSITMDGDYDLIASCRSASGQQKLSSISLNDCLANINGEFRWAKGGGFGGSARNARLIEDGRVLEAELGMGGDRGWNHTRVRLDERITNNDGELKLLH